MPSTQQHTVTTGSSLETDAAAPTAGYRGPAQPERIAVFRALKLGDMLCAAPALRALRRRFPRARIALVALGWARTLARPWSDSIDEVIPFPGYPGLPEGGCPPADVRERFFESMRARRFDLAIQLHGSGEISNKVVASFGARHTVGFASTSGALDQTVPFRDDDHEVKRGLRLIAALGGTGHADADLAFAVSTEDEAEIQSMPILEAAAGRPWVCVHAGSSRPERRWPAERFATAADWAASQGYAILLTGKPNEHDTAQAVARFMREPAIDLTPLDLSLGATAALIRRAQLLLTNDTGVSHLAIGVKTPSVVIFTADDAYRWAPLNRDRHVALPGGRAVSVVQVVGEMRRLLGSGVQRD